MDVQYDGDGVPFIMWGGNKIQLDQKPVTDEYFLEKARTELRETPENVEKGIRELRELLKGETSLVIPLDDDKFLIRWLRLCHFYPESAFKKMQVHYKFRQDNPDHCVDLLPSTDKNSISEATLSMINPRDQHGRRIIIIESGHRWDPNIVSLKEFFRGIELSMEAVLLEPKTQIAGVVVLFDLKDLAMKHVMQFTPSFAKMTVEYLQDANPGRVKAVHFINQPYLFNMVFALFKPFMREKLRSRFHFHGTDLKKLHEAIDTKSLRARHGGQLPDPEVTGPVAWKFLNYYEDILKEANTYGYTSTNNNKKSKK